MNKEEKMFKKVLMLTMITTAAVAETENYDMALSGDFSKDFCNLTVDSPVLNDIDTTQEGFSTRVAYQFARLTCADGDYNITYSSDVNSTTDYVAKNQRVRQRGTFLVPKEGGGSDLANPFLQNFGADSTISSSPTFSATANESGVYVATYLTPIDGEWANIDDTFTHIAAITVTIEKQ